MTAQAQKDPIRGAIKQLGSCLAALATAAPAIAGAQALTPPSANSPPDTPACGEGLSAPMLAKWTGSGADQGPLGCPTAPEAATVPSRAGTTGREVNFKNGTIIWHGSGGRAGQTYIVTGCAYRLFFQYGGAGGWLGLPISDATNTPDGQRQSFEGGRVTFIRATDECDAEPTAEPGAAATSASTTAAIATSPLDLFYDPARDDHITAAAAVTVARALGAHYARIRGEAFVFTEDPGHGATPLKLFWNESLGNHVSTATADGERDALNGGYVFEASQGFVWSDPHAGATPLKQFRDPVSGHGLLLANPVTQAEALSKGFVFVRIEGYAPVTP